MNPEVTVIKMNVQGQEVWRYAGSILARSGQAVLLQAYFDREDFLFNGMWLRKGDRFIEIYFSDRWYNIFEIHDREDDRLKGWYCNITQPAVIEDKSITYVDMALDLLVFPDGRQVILDEDEFEDLPLKVDNKIKSLAALKELQTRFTPPVRVVMRQLLENQN